MKLKILTVGTRGDVQPFVALALELMKHDYDVTICTGINFKEFVEGYGLHFLPIGVDYHELTESIEGKEMMTGNPILLLKLMKTKIIPMMEKMLSDSWEATKDAEVLIYHPKAFGGYDIAEKLGIPVFIAHPVPIVAETTLFTSPALPISLKNGWLNKASFKLNRLLQGSFLKKINKWRRETVGLTKKRSLFTDDLRINGKTIPILYGCSPTVIPYDSNWHEKVQMAGFWYIDNKQPSEPSQNLVEFLKKGIPPIAISFSSMPLKEPERIESFIREALEKTGQRGVLITGWSGIRNGQADQHLYTIESVPHEWLFPKTAGIIHHGGAGTTATAVRAGKPMIICPFSADQPFWARRMYELGVATSPLKEKDMSVDAFTNRIVQMITNGDLTANAEKLANKIKQEKGLQETVEFISKKIQNHQK